MRSVFHFTHGWPSGCASFTRCSKSLPLRRKGTGHLSWQPQRAVAWIVSTMWCARYGSGGRRTR